MKTLHINVQGNVATYCARDGYIVCGNDEAYKIKFTLDSDWAALEGIKVHFIWNGQHFDRDMQDGFTCEVPQLINTEEVEVGLFTSTKRTTTGAKIPCKRSILCRSTTPSVEGERYHISEAKEAADRAEAAAELAATYVPKDGKDAYEYAKAGGYPGTETEFAQQMATGIPTLPYGGSKEWLEANGDKTKLYQIDGYIWGYIVSNGWTKSNTSFLVVSRESQMTNAGGTEYLLRSGNEGTVYAYHEASGDIGIPVYGSLPETANDGDVVAVGSRVYQATVTTKVVPAYTNLADTSSPDWKNGYRLTSSGGVAEAEADSMASNFIPCKLDDIVRVKGFQYASGYNRASWYYDSNKESLLIMYPSTETANNFTYDSATQTATFIAGRYAPTTGAAFEAGTAYMRCTIPLATGYTPDDIIITVNEEIKNKTVTEVIWTDIGTYIPPVAAGWSATAETFAVIDSLSAIADNGDTAVYSGDGYAYSYIEGADWMATSKYITPKIAIDDGLSYSSVNPVQNKVVTTKIDEINRKATSNASAILNLQNEVESIGGGASSEVVTIPSYWASMVATKTETVKALQTAGGKDCISFAWASDTHIPDGEGGDGKIRTNDIGKVMAKMLDNCEIPFAMLSGDVSTRASFSAEADLVATHEQLPKHLSPLWGTERLLMALGNHDGCWGDSTGYYRKQFTPERMWQVFFRGQALDFRRVFSNDGLYYYVDNTAQKTRFIVLNSHYGGEYAEDSNGWAVNNRFSTSCYGQAQLDWLADIALDMPEGYSAIITAHVPPDRVGTVDKAQLIGIINAYCNKSTYSGSYTAGVDGWSNSTVNVDFTNAKGEIIAMFAGHVHGDSINTTAMACPILTILSAGAGANDPYKEDEPTRKAGTDTETSFDVVTIDKATRKIYCTRVGAGADREIGY